MKKELYIRFANENSYYKWVNVDTKKIENPIAFPNEIFFTIDNVRVATPREDWERLQNEITENQN